MNYNMYNSFEMDEIDVVVVYVCRVVCMVSIYDTRGWMDLLDEKSNL